MCGTIIESLLWYQSSHTVHMLQASKRARSNAIQGMCHTVALPFTFKAKEELRKLKYFTMQKL